MTFTASIHHLGFSFVQKMRETIRGPPPPIKLPAVRNHAPDLTRHSSSPRPTSQFLRTPTLRPRPPSCLERGINGPVSITKQPNHKTARRLINESFQPAVILEVVMYDWSRGSGYSGSYAAPGTSNSGSAERRAEAEGVGRAEAAGAEGDGGGPVDGEGRTMLPIVEMDACPCPPELLFRDGDVYEEEEEEGEGEGGGLTLVRSDGGVVERGREGGGGGGGGVGQVEDLLTAGDLACDVGGLDGQLEDIARRVLSTRSIPAEVCLIRPYTYREREKIVRTAGARK